MCGGWGVWLRAECQALGTAQLGTQELVRGKAASHIRGHRCPGNKTRAGSLAGAAWACGEKAQVQAWSPVLWEEPRPAVACRTSW